MQNSVFEGRLSPAQQPRLKELITSELDLETDQVRVYSLCRTCRDLVKTYGIGPEVPDPDEPIVL